MLSV
ncbi:hypothetical protein YPPY98_0099, partial [Yersinia pestis PY-98]|jgi:hypothetical protein